jgi:Helix-turn-helix domain
MVMRAVAGGEGLDGLLTEVAAADFLSLSTRTLQAWRSKGFGPAFVRAGRAIRYRRRDLLAWMDANTVASTARRDAGRFGRPA